MVAYARKLIVFLIFLAAFAANSALAAFPQPTGYVNDFAGVLDTSAKSQLEQLLTSFEAKTGDEVAVVTVKSLDGAPIEDYAVRLYQQWGIGKKGKDNGVLILVCPPERQIRIEVGYGLEGMINDAMAGRIIREKMVPAFKEGAYDQGIIAGTQTVLQLIAKDRGITLGSAGGAGSADDEVYQPRKRSLLHKIGSILMLLLLTYLFVRHPWLFLIVLSGMGRSSGRGGGFGSFGGGPGGGFGGFGGGLSGGGGASGRW